MNPPPVATREIAREERFNIVWTQELNDVFADVAPYYDRANYFASLGLWGYFLRQFMATVDIKPGEKMLDVCAGTNAIGIALLKREPTLEVHAIDRSAAMQEVGRQRAEALGFRIQQRDRRRAHAAVPGQHVRHRDAAVRVAPPAHPARRPGDPPRAQARRALLPQRHAAAGEPDRGEAVLRLPALLPVVHGNPVPQRAPRAQLQGLLHPGAADVLFRARS